MTYIVKRVDGSGASTSDFRFRPTVHFEVIHEETGECAWTGHARWASDGARSIQGARLQASNMAKKYAAYLARTGKRWEVIQREKLAADRAEKKRVQRLEYLRKHVPLMTEELRVMELESKGK